MMQITPMQFDITQLNTMMMMMMQMVLMMVVMMLPIQLMPKIFESLKF